MLRLTRHMDKLRLFVGEASHQLRTPLAALRSQVRNALEEGTPEASLAHLHAAERQAESLSRLAEQLLNTVCVTHVDYRHLFETIDLADIALQAIEEAIPPSACPELELIGMDHTAKVHGNAVMLKEAIKNLIDNAMKYGDLDKGPLLLAVEPMQDGWRFRVADHGPGIATEDMPHVFEDFRRGADRSVQGAGLGLALVRRVVAAHRGAVGLRNRPEGGLEIWIALPGAPS
jgi:two-component system sensor histidine kinase TctE